MDNFLSIVKPFKYLSPGDRQRLNSISQEKRYSKGETIFHRGDLSDAVWVVKSGRIHLRHFMPDGKAATVCVMITGDPFCCLPSLDRKTYPADAIAGEDSTVIRVPLEAFHRAMTRSQTFMQETLCLFCDRLRQVEGRTCLVYESAESKLAHLLLALSNKFGLTIPLTRQELSEIAGTTLETTIRILSRFKENRLIRSTRGKTTIVAAKKLSTLCHE